jgi:hypothetical protein
LFCSFYEIHLVRCHRVAVHAPQFYAAISRKNGRAKNRPGDRQAGDVMSRRMPIVFVVLSVVVSAPRVQAEPGFFEQLLGSLKSAASTKSEPVTEAAATSVESEPLALQPTETTTERLSTRKRHRSYRGHREAAPVQRSRARTESPPAASEKPPAQESSVPREFIDNAKPAEQVQPSTDADNVRPAASAWPNQAPEPLAPWPVEDARAEAAQAESAPAARAEPPHAEQAEPHTAMTGEVGQISVNDTEAVEADSFLDPQRLMLAFIAVVWLTLGLLTFAFRRQLARAFSALRRHEEQPRKDEIPADVRRQPLTLILKNATDGGTVIEKVRDKGARAVSVG